jgi:type IV pilus assembly protein PilP
VKIRYFAIVILAVAGLKAFAQDPAHSDPAMPAPPASAPAAEQAAFEASTTAGIFAGFLDPFDYDSRGRRDPFAQPVADVPMAPGPVHGPLLPLQAFEVSQLRVVGILWNVRSPKAMVKDPEGKLHIVETNTKVGPRNGYIAVIREGELVVVETIEQEGRLVSTAQVVKIAK